MNILVVKTSSLGDIVQAFPVLEYLHAQNKNHHIDWVVEAPFASLVKSHPHINDVIEIDTQKWRKAFFNPKIFSQILSTIKQIRKKKYDLVIDLQGNIKSSFPTFFSKSKIKIGFDSLFVAEWPNLLFTNRKERIPEKKNIREDYLNLVKKYFNDDAPFLFRNSPLKLDCEEQKKLNSFFIDKNIDPKECIMVCPGTQWNNKQLSLSQLSKFLELVFIEESEPFFIFVWGTSKEKEMCKQLNHLHRKSFVLEKVSIPMLQNFMFKVRKIIAMDSFPLHLAGTTETAIFGIFGPSSPEKYAPNNKASHFYFGKCPYNYTFEKRCKLLRVCKTGACLKEAAPDEIYKSYLAKSCVKK